MAKPTADKKTTADKFRWLDQVGADGGLTPLCFRLAYVIATFVNRETGDAWPRQERLAQECRVSERAIRTALTLLRDRNHLAISSGAGRGTTSRYRPIIWDQERRKPASTIQPVKAEASFHDNSEKGGSLLPTRRNLASKKGGSQLPTIPKKESIEETIERKSLAMIPQSDFELFWTAYPRKVAKAKAERTYLGIVKAKRAGADELLEGAKRYAAARSGQDPKYTKHPATWLNGACWMDEPEPTAARPAKVTQADTAIEGFNRFLNRSMPQ